MTREGAASDFASLQKTLDYYFKDESFLIQAFTHPSYAYESQEKEAAANGRLEFLGDSILGMVVSEYLYRKFPAFPEGELTRQRSMLVNRSHLSAKAQEMKLAQHLRLGKGEEKMGGRKNATNLEGALEAVIGAIYLDGGFEEAERFILRAVM